MHADTGKPAPVARARCCLLARSQKDKSFLLLFFKKEVFFCFVLKKRTFVYWSLGGTYEHNDRFGGAAGEVPGGAG
jgi:hypothetical protein